MFTSEFHEGWKCPIDVTAILTVDNSKSATPNLNNIKFEKPITKSFDVNPGEGWSYKLPKPTYLVLDDTVNVNDIKIKVSSPNFIMFFDKELMLVSSRKFTEKDEDATISITLYDDFGQSTKFSITIKVKLPEPPANDEEKKDNQQDAAADTPDPKKEEEKSKPVAENSAVATALAN